MTRLCSPTSSKACRVPLTTQGRGREGVAVGECGSEGEEEEEEEEATGKTDDAHHSNHLAVKLLKTHY